MKLIILFIFSFISFMSFSQKKKDIKSINIVVTEKNFCPGKQFSIGVHSTLYNGKELKTRGLLKGKSPWRDYSITVQGGKHKMGKITLSNNFHEFKNEKFTITVRSKKTKSAIVTKTIKLNYKGYQIAKYSGKKGQDGFDGNHGSTGKDGNGTNGKDGKPGQNGETGKYVIVSAKTEKKDNTDFLKIIVEDLITKTKSRYIVNTNGGKITIDVSGGKGGEGGTGGKGGKGRNQTESESAGVGGNGGNGSNGGNGGDAGSITIFMDSTSYKNYKELIILKVDGGLAGEYGQGGRKGKGGKTDKEANAVGQVLGTDRAKKGKNGDNGENGKDGNNGEITIQVFEEIEVDF